MTSNTTDDDRTVIYTGSSSPLARLVCLDTMLDECLRTLDIQLGVQDETLGRSDNNTITIKYNKMSRNHARITFENNKWVLEDLNSANGIYINEHKIDKAAMGQGDIVVIGQVPFRFEIEHAPPGTEAPAAAPAADDYEGDSGTMYAQHVGVIESLANINDSEEEKLEDLPPPPPSLESSEPDRPQAASYSSPQRSSGGSSLKWLWLILLLLGGAGGGWYWLNSAGSKQADQLAKSFGQDLKAFLEQIESSNAVTPGNVLRDEISKLQIIAARVDVAQEQNRGHAGLQSLDSQLTFLSFERQLSLLLQNSEFFDAEHLINTSQERLNTAETNPTEDYQGLLELSKTAVQFRRFSQQFGEPSLDAARQPDQYEMSKMLETKARFIELKKKNYQNLSVVYTRLHQVLEQVEEQDIRNLNRWQEIRKRVQ